MPLQSASRTRWSARFPLAVGFVAILLMLGGLESITGAIVGARSAAQVRGFAGAMDLRLAEEDLAEIAAALPASVGLL